MSGKKRNGEGALRKRSDNSYEYRIRYIDELGDRKRKSFYGRTEKECLDQAEDFLAVQELKNRDIDCSLTIPDILREKFEYDYSMNYVSEAAYDRNLHVVKIIEKSSIGNKPIINVSERDLEMFLKSITPYANNTISKIYQRLKLAYNIAVEDDIVAKNLMNARKLQRRPKSIKPDREVKGFTEEEQKLFMEAMETYKAPAWRHNDYKNQMLIELYTGMRMGEINALKPEDIDFSKGVIHVRRTISKGLDERTYLKDTTKTVKGTREVPINELVRPILEDAIACAPKNSEGLLFYDTGKKSVVTTSQVNCAFKRVIEKAGIPVRGQHSLRHTFATRCIEAGVPAVVLKDWMGHTNIHITLDTYADVFARMNNDAMKKFEEYTGYLKSESNWG